MLNVIQLMKNIAATAAAVTIAITLALQVLYRIRTDLK